MLSKTNPEASPILTVRGEMLIMGSIENWLIRGVQEDNADIRGDPHTELIEELGHQLMLWRCG